MSLYHHSQIAHQKKKKTLTTTLRSQPSPPLSITTLRSHTKKTLTTILRSSSSERSTSPSSPSSTSPDPPSSASAARTPGSSPPALPLTPTPSASSATSPRSTPPSSANRCRQAHRGRSTRVSLSFLPMNRLRRSRIRLFAAKDDIFCIFEGVLDNLASMRQHYGLSKGANEVMLLIEAYKTLRDKAPHPASFMLGHLSENFSFVIFDKATSTVLVASDPHSKVPLYWGITSDGCIMHSLLPRRRSA